MREGDVGLVEALRVEGNIPVDLPVSNGARFLFISKDQRALTHGLHKYPAKFFPELPRWLIEKYSKCGDKILDPFMGSGTTNLEAMLLGHDSIGVDVDPFSQMLTRAKTTLLSEKHLVVAWELLEPRIRQYWDPRNLVGVPEFPYRNNWFKPFILKELAHIKREILETDTNRNIHNFFLIVFSGIIRAVSNADNNCTRTVIRKKLDKKIYEGMAIKMFLRRAQQQVENMRALIALRPKGKVSVLAGADAKQMPTIKDGSIDFAITSPPYVNAVDYPRTHQLEMYWLGLADGSLRDLKAKHIGTEVVFSKDYSKLHEVGCPMADHVIKQIYRQDPRRAYIASKYLLDMFANLCEVKRVLRSGGYYVIVVGNNSIRGINFENWRYLQAKAQEIGFEVDCVFASEIINHFIKVPRQERISRDHILVLRK